MNDSMPEMSGRELQVRKANNISWKINYKSPYRPSGPIRYKKVLENGILQVNNARYIMCSGTTNGEMKLDTYVGKPVSLN